LTFFILLLGSSVAIVHIFWVIYVIVIVHICCAISYSFCEAEEPLFFKVASLRHLEIVLLFNYS